MPGSEWTESLLLNAEDRITPPIVPPTLKAEWSFVLIGIEADQLRFFLAVVIEIHWKEE
jgi:hypothetical protein